MAQWVKDPSVVTTVAWVQSLAQELPYAASAAKKKQKTPDCGRSLTASWLKIQHCHCSGVGRSQELPHAVGTTKNKQTDRQNMTELYTDHRKLS